MPTVKVLVEGVGTYNKGDIVPDAPLGLVEMAEKETRNAATGELIAEFVDDVSDEYETLKTKAKELKIRGFANMKFETLKAAVESAEASQVPTDAEQSAEASQAPADAEQSAEASQAPADTEQAVNTDDVQQQDSHV